MWPLYVRLSHVSRYGAALLSIIVLTAWIYAFSFILILGAEVIAVASMIEMSKKTEASEQASATVALRREQALPRGH